MYFRYLKNFVHFHLYCFLFYPQFHLIFRYPLCHHPHCHYYFLLFILQLLHQGQLNVDNLENLKFLLLHLPIHFRELISIPYLLILIFQEHRFYHFHLRNSCSLFIFSYQNQIRLNLFFWIFLLYFQNQNFASVWSSKIVSSFCTLPFYWQLSIFMELKIKLSYCS